MSFRFLTTARFARWLFSRRTTFFLRCTACLLVSCLFTGCQTVPQSAPSPETRSGESEVAIEFPELPSEMLPPSEPVVEPKKAEVNPPIQSPMVPRSSRVRNVGVDGRFIALTFDDGPSPRNTTWLLDILKERQVRATFFVVGERAAAHPRILQRMAAEGHEIANHTWNHATITQLNADALKWQVGRTSQAIQTAIGRGPTLIRPPYGVTTPTLNRWLAENMGLTVVLWSVDSLDWKNRDSASVQKEILAGAKPGAIILAHDIHATTVAAMPKVLDRLTADGYQFVTVSELIAMERPR